MFWVLEGMRIVFSFNVYVEGLYGTVIDLKGGDFAKVLRSIMRYLVLIQLVSRWYSSRGGGGFPGEFWFSACSGAVDERQTFQSLALWFIKEILFVHFEQEK